MNKIPYTDGGGKVAFGKPFSITFIKDVPNQDIVKGYETKTYIVKMSKHKGIMLYPPTGEKDFYIVCPTEEAVQDLIEFNDLPEFNKSYLPPAAPPTEESGTEVILPY